MTSQGMRSHFSRTGSKQLRSLLFAIAGLALLCTVLPQALDAATQVQNEKLSRLIAAAKEEGVIDFSGPPELTPRGTQALISGLNKKYNLNLNLNYVPTPGYPIVTSQLITEIQAGQSATYDVVYLTELNLVKLYSRGFLVPFDWTGTFSHITKDSVYFDNGGLLTATIFALPAYNTRLVSSQDVPKQWEDLLDPKWKGKIVAPKFVQVWVSLAQTWGEKRTTDFLNRLKTQEPLYVKYSELRTRLESGEYPLAANHLSSMVDGARQRGIPVDYADLVKPIPVLLDMMGIPKNARHPNTAKLFMAFSLTPEGQEIWFQFAQRSSLFTQGTPAWRFSRGKDLLLRDMKALVKNPEVIEQLEKRFADVLGIR